MIHREPRDGQEGAGQRDASVQNGGAPLHGVQTLTPEERQRVIYDFNETATSLPEVTLAGMFERQAANTPQNIALQSENRELSYAALDARANQLAWSLIEDGIGPEDIVAISMERSIEMIVAILGTLKAGAAYLPLDPDYPAERLDLMIEDAQPKRILTAPLEDLDRFPCFAPGNNDRIVPLRARHPAYLIYTSGSTGTPKGVLVTNSAISNSIEARNRFYQRSLEALPFTASISFDISVAQIFWTLCHGAKLLIVALPLTFEPGLSVTHLMMPAAVYASFLIASRPGDSHGLRSVVVGGDSLSSQTVKLHRNTFKDVELFNEYGLTEAAIWSTVGRFDPNADVSTEFIGGPVANTRVYVLDSALQPCPIGAVGELYIAGAGLARGYWHLPALTAEHFVANPFAIEPGERLYRTGDLASWREDGGLLFHGRTDRQVKIRGYRIEPGEIEAALLNQPGIAQAAVITREDGTGDQRLVAYLAGAKEVDLQELRRHLALRLPEYMVPSAFVVLEALPLTANGKLDRKALPLPEGSGLAAGYVAPITPEEILLCDLVAELLGIEQAGLADNFFHLGGHSLLATRLAAQVRTRLDRELPLRSVFETPLLGGLARGLRTLPKAGMPLVRQQRPTQLPLSFAQLRLWLLHRLEGATPNYNIPVGLRLQGALDTVALERALGDLLIRHESLRTLLVEGEGGPQQLILAAQAAPLTLRTVASSPTTVVDDLAAEAAHGFELAQQIPFRATLFQLGADDHALLLLLHHSAADGWSVAPLLQDLAFAYAARRKGEEPAFVPLAVQYADYTLWQRALLGSEDDATSPMARQITYWTEKLAHLPVELALPTDRKRRANPSYAGGAVDIPIPATVYERLQDIGRSQGATLFMLLQAALAVLLSKLERRQRHPHRGPHRGSYRSRARQPRRLLRQHPGVAHRHRRRSILYPAGKAGSSQLPGSLCSSGRSPRAAGRGP